MISTPKFWYDNNSTSKLISRLLLSKLNLMLLYIFFVSTQGGKQLYSR